MIDAKLLIRGCRSKFAEAAGFLGDARGGKFGVEEDWGRGFFFNFRSRPLSWRVNLGLMNSFESRNFKIAFLPQWYHEMLVWPASMLIFEIVQNQWT